MILKRIKDLRKDSDKKQHELALYLGISQQTYSDHERGKSDFSFEELVKIADFYNVSLDYLFGRKKKYESKEVYQKALDDLYTEALKNGTDEMKIKRAKGIIQELIDKSK